MRLGIDFGTTRTVVAAVDRGNYPLLSFENPDGAQVDWFPSLVAVRGGERRYGWEAWACQQDPDWTVVRSLKRVLQDAGPNTILEMAGQHVPLIQVLREMAAALRALLPQEKLEVMLGVPANANSNQRFLTVEAFRSAGCDVIGLLNEPSAASIEFGHKNKISGVILVYDLGGGTFDASLVEVGEKIHRPLATESIATLGGDDFDEILAEMATTNDDRDSLSQNEHFRLLEECRLRKEALSPNTRRIVIDLGNVREGWSTVTVPVAEYYERCRPLVDETLNVVEDLLDANSGAGINALYVTGGGSELPIVSRVLREQFGKRVQRSVHARSATALGLAIQADAQAGYVLREKFTRYFGVWREADAGQRDPFRPAVPERRRSARPRRRAARNPPVLQTGPQFRAFPLSGMQPFGRRMPAARRRDRLGRNSISLRSGFAGCRQRARGVLRGRAIAGDRGDVFHRRQRHRNDYDRESFGGL